MKNTIAIEIDVDQLGSYADDHLATLWHVAQANPVGLEDERAGELAEAIGREIIRRWLKAAPPTLWRHQGKHHYWDILAKHGKWLPVDGDKNRREWTPNERGTEADG